MKGIRYKKGYYNTLKSAIEESGDSFEEFSKDLSKVICAIAEGDPEKSEALAKLFADYGAYMFSLGAFYALQHPEQVQVEEVKD